MCWCRPEVKTPNCGGPQCHPPADAGPARTLWQGTLARSGRVEQPFQAEIVEHAGRTTVLERRGLEAKTVSPHEISGSSWMAALLELAKRSGAAAVIVLLLLVSAEAQAAACGEAEQAVASAEAEVAGAAESVTEAKELLAEAKSALEVAQQRSAKAEQDLKDISSAKEYWQENLRRAKELVADRKEWISQEKRRVSQAEAELKRARSALSRAQSVRSAACSLPV